MTSDKKPPFGIEPEWLFKIRRLRKLEEALSRYVVADSPIPVAWIEERNRILSPEQLTNFYPGD